MSKTGTAYIDHVTDDGIAVLIIDYFPVNALSAGLLNGVRTVMRQLEGKDPGIDQKITGLVVMGAGDRAFCAGADIMAFNTKGGKPVSIGRPTSGPFGKSKTSSEYFSQHHSFSLTISFLYDIFY